MAFKLEFLPEAETDLNEAIDWYSSINKELAKDFLLRLERAYKIIQAHPDQFTVVYKKFRKLSLERFPYKIVYTIEKQKIIIVAVAHHKRHPLYWKKRN